MENFDLAFHPWTAFFFMFSSAAKGTFHSLFYSGGSCWQNNFEIYLDIFLPSSILGALDPI
jgi:hypothetical protein